MRTHLAVCQTNPSSLDGGHNAPRTSRILMPNTPNLSFILVASQWQSRWDAPLTFCIALGTLNFRSSPESCIHGEWPTGLDWKPAHFCLNLLGRGYCCCLRAICGVGRMLTATSDISQLNQVYRTFPNVQQNVCGCSCCCCLYLLSNINNIASKWVQV